MSGWAFHDAVHTAMLRHRELRDPNPTDDGTDDDQRAIDEGDQIAEREEGPA